MDLSEQTPLVVEHLSKTFGRRTVVRDLSFQVRPGEVVGLLGPNGSGKSTTLHCITGLYVPTKGSILFNGRRSDTAEAKGDFGFFPDDLPYPAALTGQEVLAFYRALRPVFDDEMAASMVDILGLGNHMTKPVGDFSHGMRRKLQLVVAFAHHPRCLILDEPMRGLDPEAAALMDAAIHSFRRAGGGVLVATHDLDSAARDCDRVVVLSDGECVGSGAPVDLMKEHDATSLQAAFVEMTGLRARVDTSMSQLDTLMIQMLGATEPSGRNVA